MAVAFVQEFPIIGDDRSTANYDAVSDHVMGSGVPDGLVSHSAGFDEDAEAFAVNAHVVGHHRQVFDARIADGVDQVRGDAAEPEAADGDRLAVAQDVL